MRLWAGWTFRRWALCARKPAETGRPGYDPRDLLKLYLYGYLEQMRSSRRLEAECRRNVEVMWLLGRLAPDYKSIAEFRRMHREAVTEAGAELVRFARSVGLVRGEWVAIDGSKFQAVASARSVAERESVKRYLDAVEAGDQQEEAVIDPSAVAAALEKLKSDAEPEAGFMRTAQGYRASLQRADRGGCRTRADRGAGGDHGEERQPQSAAHGRSGAAGASAIRRR